MSVYAGAARRIITPDWSHKPTYLAGFQENRLATGLHDDLEARALAIRVETNLFILVVCDLIGLLHTDIQRIRTAVRAHGVDAHGLVVACTHTHSGPDTLGLWGRSRLTSGRNLAYQTWLIEQTAQAVVETVAALKPATLRVGRADMPHWLRNARQPAVVDRELEVLQAVDHSGETLFTLLNMACHPEVMSGDNTLISADFAGAARQAVEAQTGGIAIWAAADLGGMMTPDVGEHGRSFATVAQMGRDVAAIALEALHAGESLAPKQLRFTRRNVRIPLDNPLFKLARFLGTLPAMPLDAGRQICTQVALLDLGRLRMITVPGELLPTAGMRLRTMLNAPYRFLIGLADDELGYIIPSDEFVYPRNPFRPEMHYEESMSVSRYALPLLSEAWMAMLGED